MSTCPNVDFIGNEMEDKVHHINIFYNLLAQYNFIKR